MFNGKVIIGGDMINTVVKILLILSSLMGLFLTPAYATSSHYTVHYVIEHQSSYEPEICPYVNVGYGHSGTWDIWGWVCYDNGRSNVQYRANGHVVPIFDKYWGYHKPVPGFHSCAFDSLVTI
jgi:hypothetical protein